MSICWYCYWGWSKPVRAIYDKYIEIAGESAMHSGAAHIVWEDENFERHHIQSCLDDFPDYDYSEEQNQAVKQSLLEMLELPDEIRDPEPKDYDGVNPDKYPPTIEMDRG